MGSWRSSGWRCCCRLTEAPKFPPSLCKQGVTGSIPVTSTRTLLLSFPQFTLQLRPPILQGVFSEHLEHYDFWKVKAVADRLGLCDAHIYFLVAMRL